MKQRASSSDSMLPAELVLYNFTVGAGDPDTLHVTTVSADVWYVTSEGAVIVTSIFWDTVIWELLYLITSC